MPEAVYMPIITYFYEGPEVTIHSRARFLGL
jgi:hypothetical protein